MCNFFRAERTGGGGAKRRRRRRSVANLNFFFTREGPNESILLLGHVVNEKVGVKVAQINPWRRGPVDMSLDFKIERQYLTRVRLRGRVKVAKVMLSLAALQSFITTE